MNVLARIGAAIAVGTGIAYVVLIVRQGEPIFWPTVALVVAMIAALATLAAYGGWGPTPERRAMSLWAAVPGFFGLGFLSAWSIGGFLPLGGIPTTIAAVGALREVEPDRRGRVIGLCVAAVVTWLVLLALLLALAQASSSS